MFILCASPRFSQVVASVSSITPEHQRAWHQRDLHTIRAKNRAADDPSHEHFLAGTGKFFDDDFAAAVTEFDMVSDVSQPDRYRMTRLKALALARLNRHDEADREAGKLFTLAANKDQRESARLTLEDVRRARQEADAAPYRRSPLRPRARPAPPPQDAVLAKLTQVEGDLTAIECLGSQPIFVVRTGSQTMKLWSTIRARSPGRKAARR
jgi:hypothetical protein